jgi:hypothetical protein
MYQGVVAYNNNECTTCEFIVDFIRYEINIGNKTISDISELIRDICSKIVGPGGKECIVIANDLQNISKMIANGINNTNICEILHFCN